MDDIISSLMALSTALPGIFFNWVRNMPIAEIHFKESNDNSMCLSFFFFSLFFKLNGNEQAN